MNRGPCAARGKLKHAKQFGKSHFRSPMYSAFHMLAWHVMRLYLLCLYFSFSGYLAAFFYLLSAFAKRHMGPEMRRYLSGTEDQRNNENMNINWKAL